MRVISGYLKGRSLEGFNTLGTRPTMDRVKESMFATIQNYIPESIVLDLFSGTGSLGIEAISNGAKYCYFVDNGKEIIKHLNKNINNLNIKDKTEVLTKDYHDALLYFNKNNVKFNVILVDAPYKMQIMEEVISLVNKYDLLYPKGLLVLEFSFDKLKENYPGFDLYKSKKYGDKFVYTYIKNID